MASPLKKFLYFCAAEAWINLFLFIASLAIVFYFDLDQLPDSDSLHVKVVLMEVVVALLAWAISEEEVIRGERK